LLRQLDEVPGDEVEGGGRGIGASSGPELKGAGGVGGALAARRGGAQVVRVGRDHGAPVHDRAEHVED
jgi:hypothetical protein